MKKLLFFYLLVCISSFLISAYSATYYVAKIGDDLNDGLTKETPFLTIGKAAVIAVAGDTVYIMEGTYEETLSPSHNGNSGNPIVFQSYPGHKVIISAMQSLSEWILDSDNVYKTSVNWDLGQRNMVFNENTFMDLARWPNNTDGNQHTQNGLINSGGSDGSTDQNSYLTYTPGIPEIDWANGGSLFFYCTKAGWTAWKTWIKSSDATGVVFDFNKNGSWVQTEHPPADLGNFYLEGVRGALDYQNEWYYNSSTETLYVQIPGGEKPADGAIKMRRRNYTIDLRNRSYIEIRNLAVTGGEIQVAGSAAHNLIYGVTSMYGNHIRGIQSSAFTNSQSILLDGSYNTIERCEVGYGTGNGIYVKGSHNKVINSHVHHFNTLGCYDAVLNMRSGNNSKIYNNTLSHGGRDVVQAFNNWSDFGYNDVSYSNLIANDCGLIYTVGGPRNMKIHHNWFHDAYAVSGQYKAAGIYLDNDASSFRVYNNVVWNTDWTSIQINWNGIDIDIFNNTLVDGSDVMGAWHKDGTAFSDVNVWNNLSNKSGWEPQSDKQNNLTYTADPFIDRAKGDFRLKEDSEPIDNGREISGYTEGFTGTSPDIGAYEYGKEAWVAGIDWDTRFGPAYNGCYGIPGEDCEQATGQAAYPQGEPHKIPGRIETEDYDLGPASLAYSDSSQENEGGLYRNDGVDLISISDNGDGFGIGFIKKNEWQEYTVQIDTAGNYILSARVSSESTEGKFRIELDEKDVSGDIVFPATGNWDTWKNVEFPVYLKEGIHELRFIADTSDFRTNYMDFLLVEGEDILLVDTNTIYRRSLSYKLIVEYSTFEERSITVALWNGSTLLGETSKDIQAGSKRDTLEILLTDLPNAGSGYSFKTYMTAQGESIDNALSAETLADIVFLDESIEWMNVPDSLGLFTEYSFMLNHKVATNSSVHIEFWNADKLLADKSVEVLGNGTTNLKLNLSNIPDPGNSYILKAFLIDISSQDTLDSHIISNIELIEEVIEALHTPRYILTNEDFTIDVTYLVFEIKYLFIELWLDNIRVFKKIVSTQANGRNSTSVDIALPALPDGSNYSWRATLSTELSTPNGLVFEGETLTIEKEANIATGSYSIYSISGNSFLIAESEDPRSVNLSETISGWDITRHDGNIYIISVLNQSDSLLYLSYSNESNEDIISITDSIGDNEKWAIVKQDTLYRILPKSRTNYHLGIDSIHKELALIRTDVAEAKGLWEIESFESPVSVEELQDLSLMNYYPNPVKGILNIDFSGEIPGNRVVIYDITGKVVLHLSTRDSSLQIDTKSFTPGIFVLEVSNGVSKTRHLIIVQ